ncbi:hypothetical protein BU24DRAFT_7192 [Aaosphaeria arxii CBS 175.79]|uniref:Uncharacterized protein n=1 Tax=Aaosphaeria arxii CBS 175.79 TaxID=1450172 RepID=A0A6A5Y680_9PLEO|nr:uncharacterized protein BU24DRAFT_7192 [Aaosphaeria arxii CBS 175.79]KAF2020713.1 hypothetical protein BU24DRAFT_7192 [Aaosphaeria arxii CBS 175.79]
MVMMQEYSLLAAVDPVLPSLSVCLPVCLLRIIKIVTRWGTSPTSYHRFSIRDEDVDLVLLSLLQILLATVYFHVHSRDSDAWHSAC